MGIVTGEIASTFIFSTPSTERFFPRVAGLCYGWLCFVPLLSSRDFPEEFGVGCGVWGKGENHCDFQNTSSQFKRRVFVIMHTTYMKAFCNIMLYYKLKLVCITNIINIPQMLINSSAVCICMLVGVSVLLILKVLWIGKDKESWKTPKPVTLITRYIRYGNGFYLFGVCRNIY